MRTGDAPTFTLLIVLTGIPAIVLLFGLLPGNPYSYFQFLQVVVCFAVACYAVVAYRLGSVRLTLLLALISAFYNPFFSVEHSELIWWPVHLLTIVVLGAIGWSLSRRIAEAAPRKKSKKYRLN
jgi:hypothetical protein